MSTAGILRPDEVVFYHPLDSDFKEQTVNEVWSGTAASVPGKVGGAESAVTSNNIALGALSTVVAGTANFQNDPIDIASLSPTSVVATYGSNAPNGDGTGKARAGVISGTGVTWGTPVIFRASPSSAGASQTQGDTRALDATHVIIGYGRATPLGGSVWSQG